jgi:hypothetical protein
MVLAELGARLVPCRWRVTFEDGCGHPSGKDTYSPVLQMTREVQVLRYR